MNSVRLMTNIQKIPIDYFTNPEKMCLNNS